MPGGKKPPGKQDAAVAALLTEPTIAAAAARAGLAERTLRGWLKRPRFLAAYREARRQVVENALGQLQQATGDAVATLRRLLTCGNPPTEARAAVAILEQATRAVEWTDLAAEVEDLRRQLAEVT